MTRTLPAQSGASVYDRLELLLPLVSKPIQYVGGELNATLKEWESTTVRWAIMYPDAYEVGAPNQGVQILYEVLNERDDVLAERTYAVWPDLEALMREHSRMAQRNLREAMQSQRLDQVPGVRLIRKRN